MPRALGHVGDDAKAAPPDRLDAGLGAAVVADRPAHRLDAAADGRFGHDAPVPDLFNDLVLGDDPVPVFEQLDQEVEDLWLDGHGGAATANLVGVRVDRAAIDREN